MNVFGNTNTASVVKSNKAIVKIGSATLLALNVQITFQRTAEVLPVIGEERIISIGEPQGQFSAETIIGKKETISLLGENGCNINELRIENADECDPKSGSTIVCHDIVLNSTSITLQGGRGYVAHGVQGVFTKMSID